MFLVCRRRPNHVTEGRVIIHKEILFPSLEEAQTYADSEVQRMSNGDEYLIFKLVRGLQAGPAVVQDY